MLNYRNIDQRKYWKAYRDWLLSGLQGSPPRPSFRLDYDTASDIRQDVALELQDLPAPDMDEADAV